MGRNEVLSELGRFEAREDSRTLGGTRSEVRDALLTQFEAMAENLDIDVALTDLERKELLGMVVAFDIDKQLPAGFAQQYFTLDDNLQQLLQEERTVGARDEVQKMASLLQSL